MSIYISIYISIYSIPFSTSAFSWKAAHHFVTSERCSVFLQKTNWKYLHKVEHQTWKNISPEIVWIWYFHGNVCAVNASCNIPQYCFQSRGPSEVSFKILLHSLKAVLHHVIPPKKWTPFTIAFLQKNMTISWEITPTKATNAFFSTTLNQFHLQQDHMSKQTYKSFKQPWYHCAQRCL